MNLINQNKGVIWKICLFYAISESDRQDLFQDIILQTWKSFPSFRNESKFSTWLYRIALNTALFSRRKLKPIIEPLSPDLECLAVRTPDTDVADRLHKAIKILNEMDKTVILLYLEGFSYEEMTAITGISGGALRVKMSRIKQKLKTSVE